MAHELTGALQQALWIGDLGTAKESDIDMMAEGIDIAECRVTDARGGMAVVQQLSDIVAAAAHDLKPALGDRPQLTGMVVHPGGDRGIALDGTGEPHDSAYASYSDAERGKRLQRPGVRGTANSFLHLDYFSTSRMFRPPIFEGSIVASCSIEVPSRSCSRRKSSAFVKDLTRITNP